MTAEIQDGSKPIEETETILVKPTVFQFTDGRSEPGFVAFDGETKAFFYPIFADPKKSPVSFLYESVLQAKTEFRRMMVKAYQRRKDIMIERVIVHWEEYESIFKDTGFYRKPQEAKIMDVIAAEEMEKDSKTL